ncbi:MAG: zinc metallopeptidase [Flavobacteriales bacterium]|nr:zinc metallopeptidase [Flavobacteriales bacterium]MCB9447715.1 zinc metallopeptidase [Flavobacteriales bacterium]
MFFIIIIAFALVGAAVSSRLKNRFAKYSKSTLSSGMTGKEVAERMLRDNRITDVQVISVEGHLSDHYNPAKKTINLSKEVYHGMNVAAAAVAAHETGHAVQHATEYVPLRFRSAMVPVVSFSSRFMNFIIIGSIFLGFTYRMYMEQIIWAVIIAQGALALFSLITLPVEIDASRRALIWLESSRITSGTQQEEAKDALKWAAMTYVVAALSAVTMLLYYVAQLSGRRS